MVAPGEPTRPDRSSTPTSALNPTRLTAHLVEDIMRSKLRDVVVFSARSLMLIFTLMCALAGTTVFAGPIILGGDDLDFHGNYNSGTGPNQKGWLYIQRALASMYKGGCLTRP